MGEPSKPLHRPIHPMASLEAANTPVVPSFDCPPPSLEAAPSSGGPGVLNQYIVPTLLPFFPNTTGSSNPQTTPITPFMKSLHENNTIIGPNVTPQLQNHPSLMAGNTSTSPLAHYQQIPITQQQIPMAQQQIPMAQQQIPMTHTFPTPFQPSNFYGSVTPEFIAYNMFVQPFLAIQQPGYHFTQRTPNQDCLSRSVTSLFVKDLLEYEMPNTTKLPHFKTYDGTTDLDSHIGTYEWTMTSLKQDKRDMV
uniref:Uncharacterized protein n=1 Tax=Lactuca sativa TaxID=4236 RepID=A0A9R1XNQ2_LACSA|nr:hypothetical protein LSAT_V11C200051480 [Lactuca sativa]